MKNPIFLAIAMTILFGNLFAQAPQGFKYQMVTRSNAGEILASQNISFRMSILQGENSPGDSKSPGEYIVLYTETHLATTNAYGLATLEIGRGTPVTGNFSAINWSSTPIFLKTEIDPAGGSAFVEMGTSELLSVPYSLFSGQAGGILSMTNQERNALQNPPVGMQIYNTTTNCLNYFSGSGWYETCGSLVMNLPPEQPSNPGPPDNATEVLLEQTLSWECSDPENDPLTFDVYFGHNNPPELIFSGLIDFTYSVHELGHSMLYYWKVVAHDNQGNTTEGPVWTFTTVLCAPPQVWAGEDATICSNNPYQIVGASCSNSNFFWTTLGDGTFSDPTVLNPIYTAGVLDVQNGFSKLTLNATEVLPCPPFTSSDEVQLTIIPEPTVNAGPDQTVCYGELVYLEAVASNYFQIQWFTINGCGMFDNEQQLNSIYYPSPVCDYAQGCIDIVIYATPFSPCNIYAEDSITVCFEPAPTANSGTDQLDLAGTSTTLQGNTPDFGTGQWSIISGTGGSIANPSNPTSGFSGLAGNTYILCWTITSTCGSSTDDVTISFVSSSNCGQSFTDTRDGKVYPTVQIGTQCWMAQNLNVGTRIAGGSNQTNNGIIEKYCYENTESNCTNYGGLYQWDEMMQYTTTEVVKGICPTGWHLPTRYEWFTLTTYVSSQTANRCNSNVDFIAKSLAATTNWITFTGTCTIGNNLAANNATIFTALPGGWRTTWNPFFSNLGEFGYFWSSTQFSAIMAWGHGMSYGDAETSHFYENKAYGYSVRCLSD